MSSGRAQRLREVPAAAFANRVLGAHSALVVPMVFRNRPIGYLSALDRLGGDGYFSEEDERLLQAFAASAATAVATAQSASADALRRSLRASEEERTRWARELHDETLQELAGLKVLLSGARRSDDPARVDAAIDQAIEMVTDGIANLRALITDLRPAALDELGIEPALRALVMRIAAQSGLEIVLDVDLAYEAGRSDRRHTPELELAAYRLVQEALTNIVKHADAEAGSVRIREGDDGILIIEVADDGQGFDPGDASDGFGLVGMRERLALVGGTLEVRSRPGEGTTLCARIPVVRREPARGEPAPSPAVDVSAPDSDVA
jgi:signal transduction histidine kinase